jgi:hypothetical protein
MCFLLRVDSEQAESSQDAPYLLPRKRVSADSNQGAAVGRVGLSDGSVRDAARGELRLDDEEALLVGDLQDDGVRVVRERASRSEAPGGGGLSGRVHDLGGDATQAEVSPHHDVVV